MKLKNFLVCLLPLFVLTSCEIYDEYSDAHSTNIETTALIESESEQLPESAPVSETIPEQESLQTQEPESTSEVDVSASDNSNASTTNGDSQSEDNGFVEIDKQHNVAVNGENITLQMSYGIPKERVDNYLYTVPTVLELKAKVLNNPNNRYHVKISNLYADVGLLSDKLKNGSLLQDTMNLNFMMLPSGGYDIDQENSFFQLFKVKGINQSGEFINGFNGFGYCYPDDKEINISEDRMRELTSGVILQPIWTISIIDETTNKIYASSITDEILMKHK
jgi:lipoprotein